LSKNRLIAPFIELLRQGISPEKIALTIALGIMLGVTPVLGTTTLLCTLAALALRLNLPAIQLVNALVYPLQIILLIPFFKLGAFVFHTSAAAISLKGIEAMIHAGIWSAIESLWILTLHALVVWAVLGAIITALLYPVLVIFVRHLWKRVIDRRRVLSPLD
jgi:uncharacterized protein (DUF2062 family)